MLRCAAALVDRSDAFLEINPGLDSAEDFVAGTEYTIEQPELFVQELIDSLIGSVVLIQEVNDDHVALLSITMAPSNALLDSLWVPRKVVVHDQVAELEIDSFRRRFRCDHDGRFVAEIVHQCCTHVGGRRPGDAVGPLMPFEPLSIDGL